VSTRLRDDRGSSAIELVLLTPLLIAMIFGIVQAGLVWHARNVAVAAAQQGARLARADTGAPLDPDAIRAQTVAYLHQLGADLVGQPQVQVTETAGWVTVTVTGHAVSILPGGTLTVHGVSSGPLEAFHP
jgi:Flp pilus assembly protein TadG